MNQQATPSDTDQQQALEAFLRDGGTLAMLRGLSEDTLEQLYALGFNQYQAGKWDDAQKIFQALCMLDHYDARYFLGLGACRQSLGLYEQALQSYSYGALMDINEPRFPFHAAECHLQLGDLDGAEVASTRPGPGRGTAGARGPGRACRRHVGSRNREKGSNI